MHIVHARSISMLDLLSGMKPTPKNKKKRRRGSWRCHAKMTEHQVLETLRLYEKHGWWPTRIAKHLGVPPHQIDGVIFGGNGVRTVLIK